MSWHTWNKADKILLTAAMCFLVAVYLHLTYRDNIAVSVFLFCTEAALVGGLADWFAVTALFRRPLGFPYHTAILPHRRESFIAASIVLVQKEFFSRKKIFSYVKKADFVAKLLSWLQKEDVQKMIASYIEMTAMQILQSQAGRVYINHLSPCIEKKAAEYFSIDKFKELLQEGSSGRDINLLTDDLLKQLADKIAEPEVASAIEKMLRDYYQEMAGNSLAGLLSGMAVSFNIVNFEELTALIQEEFVSVLRKPVEGNLQFRQEIIKTLFTLAGNFLDDAESRKSIEEVRIYLLSHVPWEGYIHSVFETAVLSQEQNDKTTHGDGFGCLYLLSREALQHFVSVLMEDSSLQKTINHFIYDMAARSALQAQEMAGTIVRSVLERMTDDQLNQLVYGKAEADLVWIRINGSVVGAGIGLLLFCLLHLIWA